MFAITLDQPWATLIAEKVKWVETRALPPGGPKWTPAPVRRMPGCSIMPGDTIGIHAAKRPIKRDAATPRLLDAADAAGVHTFYDNRWYVRKGGDFYLMPAGELVATCTITETVPITEQCGTDLHSPAHLCVNAGYGLLHRPEDDPWPDGATELDVTDQLPFGDFTSGRWAWLLDNIVKLDEPIPCRGRQGVWTVPDDIAARLPAAA